MIIKILASGSSGNCTLIKSEQLVCLIDVGISSKKINNKLAEYDLSLEDIDYIFITHEHIDHIAGLSTMYKKTNAKIVLSANTLAAIKSLNKYLHLVDDERFIILNYINNSYEPLELADILVKPLKTYHDAAESVCYIFNNNQNKLVYITDTGYLPEIYYKEIENASCYIIEANHDPNLLMQSDRPFLLKQRILGDHGHLSNADSIYALAKNVGINTKFVVFAHISEECNDLDMISETKENIFNKLGISYGEINFNYALRNGCEEIKL